MKGNESIYETKNINIITISQFKRLGKEIPGWTESVQYVDNFSDVLERI